ncbi:unnamed protein product [Arctogadus glacialis]
MDMRWQDEWKDANTNLHAFVATPSPTPPGHTLPRKAWTVSHIINECPTFGGPHGRRDLVQLDGETPNWLLNVSLCDNSKGNYMNDDDE